MTDEHSYSNERIRMEGRQRGSEDEGKHDELMRVVAQELGATVEAALGIVVDYAQHFGLRVMERAVRKGKGASGRLRWAQMAVRVAGATSSRLAPTGGRVASASSLWAMRSGFRLLRRIRRGLEQGRRTPGGEPT